MIKLGLLGSGLALKVESTSFKSIILKFMLFTKPFSSDHSFIGWSKPSPNIIESGINSFIDPDSEVLYNAEK